MDNSLYPKKRARFNAVDALIVLLILLVVAAAVYIFFLDGLNGTDEVRTIQYTILVPAVPNEYVGNVKVGDHVVDSAQHYQLGTVTDYRYEPAKKETEDKENGQTALAVYENKSDLYITIKAEATLGTQYSMGGYEIGVGKTVYIRLPNLLPPDGGYCKYIDEID